MNADYGASPVWELTRAILLGEAVLAWERRLWPGAHLPSSCIQRSSEDLSNPPGED